MSFMDKTTTNTEATINLGGQHSVGGVYGWICPVCGRGVAPGQKYCGCRPQPAPVYPSYPTYPYWWYQTTCDTSTGTPSTYTTNTSNTSTTHITASQAKGYINNFGINPNTQEKNLEE